MTAAVAFALCMSSVPSAIASCNASAPYLLSLFLSGQKLSDMFNEQAMQNAGHRNNPAQRAQSLSALSHALSKLNTSIWGFYWVSIYSRRLHEVLDQLDSKPPGPVTQYYDRWDGTQLVGSAAMLKRELDSVDKMLLHIQGISAEQTAMLQQFLRQIDNELVGCIP